ALGILCRHSEAGCQHHPEQCSRSSRNNCCGNSDDVSRSYRGSHGCTQRSEAAHLAYTALFVLDHVLQRLGQLSELQHAQSDGQIDTCTHYEYDEWYSPYDTIDPYKEICE